MSAIKYRMAAACSDCPFNRSGEGLILRKSLNPGRWAEILRALKLRDHFICHKTAHEADDYDPPVYETVAATLGAGRMLCAGSIEWQRKRGVKSEYLEICEGLFGE